MAKVLSKPRFDFPHFENPCFENPHFITRQFETGKSKSARIGPWELANHENTFEIWNRG